METSLKTGFTQIFSGSPKSWGAPNLWGGGGGGGGAAPAAAPLAPPARMHIG